MYHIIARCIDDGRISLEGKKICQHTNMQNIYTRKELVVMETTIYDFHTSFYTIDIQILAFHLPNVPILGKNHCCELQRTAFKRNELFQDVLCCRDLPA